MSETSMPHDMRAYWKALAESPAPLESKPETTQETNAENLYKAWKNERTSLQPAEGDEAPYQPRNRPEIPPRL